MQKTSKDASEKTAGAYEILKEEILSCKRLPGTLFDEKAFAEQIGSSRTPVREAVLRLEKEGLLTIFPRKATIVSAISMDNVRQLYEMRRLLEPTVMKTAASLYPEDMLLDWISYFQTFSGKESFKDPDAQFHLELAEVLHNPFLFSEMKLLMAQTERIRSLSNIKKNARYASSLLEHLEIARALLERNGELAAKRMEEHLRASEEGYLSLLPEGFLKQ